MSQFASSEPRTKIVRWTVLFLIAYFLASFLDLWTTGMALLNPEAREGNVAVTSDGVYNAYKAWLITAGGAVFLGYMFVFGLKNADRVSEQWLQSPNRALFRIAIIPWMDRDKGRAALNSLNYALAFVLLRLAAAVNNAMIAQEQEGFISFVVMRVANVMPVLAATILVVLLIYWLLAMLVSPLGVRLTAMQQDV